MTRPRPAVLRSPNPIVGGSSFHKPTEPISAPAALTLPTGLRLLQVEIFCYALSPSDKSEWRQRIEQEAEHFLDVSAWSVPDIAGKISADAIHIAVNLNGYTKVSSKLLPAAEPCAGPAPASCED